MQRSNNTERSVIQKEFSICIRIKDSRKLLFNFDSRKVLIFNFSFRSHSIRRRTNVQQLTSNIDLSSSFYFYFLLFVLIELNPLL